MGGTLSDCLPPTSWVLSTDQINLYRAQRGVVNYTTGSGGLSAASSAKWTINVDSPSDWACAGLLHYNRELSLAEIGQVEEWLDGLYKVVPAPLAVLGESKQRPGASQSPVTCVVHLPWSVDRQNAHRFCGGPISAKCHLNWLCLHTADTTLPPITDGLTGVYWASNYHAGVSRWLDVSGMANHASTGGTISKASAAADLNGKDYLYGGTAATVRWPQVQALYSTDI